MDCSVDLSYEPMEIDNSSSSAEILAISPTDEAGIDTVDYRQISLTKNRPTESLENSAPNLTLRPNHVSHQEEKAGIKVYHINLERKERNKCWTLIAPASLFLWLSICTYQIVNTKCSEKFDIAHLNETLTSNLYGQAQAISSIIQMLSSEETAKLTFLCGGTGVGKTYAISMIMETLWNASNVYHYTMPGLTDTFADDLWLGLTLCEGSMFIIDDLTPKDMNIESSIKLLFEKSENLGKNLTVILVFNCDKITESFNKKCDDSFYDDLKESFNDVKALKQIIRFEPLKEEHLLKCIERELGDIMLNTSEMDHILKNFNVSLDGCKGVYTKVKSLSVV